MTTRLRLAAIPAVLAAVIGAAVLITAQRPATAAPAGYSVRVTPVTQDNDSNCVPAASSMFLSAFGIRVSQDTLALQMRTGHGTGVTDLVRVLAAYVVPKRGISDVMAMNGHQLGVTLTAQLRARHPVLLAVWDQKLPWRHDSGAHEVVVTGIRGDVVTVFDPTNVAGQGGVRRATVAVLSRALLPYMPSVLTVAGPLIVYIEPVTP